MERIAAGIRAGDRAAIRAGIDLLGQDHGRPFGMLLKADVARALRQHASLSEDQCVRLRARFADMLVRGYLPREYKEYAKLFRKIGLGQHRAAIAAVAASDNPFVRRWAWYLLTDHEGPRPRKYLRPW